MKRLFSLLALAALAACAGCGAAAVDETSPQVSEVQLSVVGAGTESSQGVEVRLEFDSQVSVSGDALEDFALLLNGEEIDASAVSVAARASATSLTFSFTPAGEGLFALYQGQLQVAAAREDGALSHITGASGAAAVLAEPISATLPSGLAIEVSAQRAGSTAENVRAQTSFEVTSPALLRCITWFSPDGGATVLLKHNHNFDTADAAACAADLAAVVNDSNCGVTATAVGATVTLTATTVEDGQLLEPCVVEGVGVAGGEGETM